MRARIIRRRVLEMLRISVTVSLPSTMLLFVAQGAFVPTMIITIASTVGFVVLFYRQLRRFRIDMPGLRVYYKYNLISAAIFCGIALIFAAIDQYVFGTGESIFHYIYSGGFLVFKLVHFFSYTGTYGISTFVSAIIVSVACLLIVLISSRFIKKHKKESRRRHN